MYFPSLNINVSNYTELFHHLLVNRSNPSGTINKLPPPITVPDQGTKSLFALIIGINAYANPLDAALLKGAVKDATDMRNYLLTDLKVPDAQIRFLTDAQARRADIIAGFKEIRDNTRIKRNDPILIHYAGHGDEVDAPTGWPAGDIDNKVQLIVPQDYSTNAANQVHGIPDYTLGALLNQIAEKHGDNITVIFDSCHSGSGTRGPRNRGLTEKQSQPIPPGLDQDIWSPASLGSALPPAFSISGSTSHVLLAACTQKERVDDLDTGGYFTQNILRILKSTGVEKLTYVSLIDRIDKIVGQNTQCDGDNRDRIIFDAKAPTTGRVCFPVKKNGTVYEMQAGTAHGITQGTEFSLHNDSLTIDESHPLCILIVDPTKEIGPFTTTLRIKQAFSDVVTLSNTACVLQTKAGEDESLRFYAPLDDRLIKLYEALAERNQFQLEKRQIRPILERENARLGLSIENGKIVFDNLDPRLTEYGLTRMPHTVANDPKEIIPVLHGAANFYWHLNREAKDKVVDGKIEIECHTLVPTKDDDESGQTIMNPIGDNLIESGVIDVEVSDQTVYGYKITNKSPRDFYLNIFYFNPSHFSIDPYWTSAIAGQSKSYPTLPASTGQGRFSSLTLGYGSGGTKMYKYDRLRGGVDIDVGYLVFFFSSENINLSKIVKQDTPFKPGGRESVPVDRPSRPVYGTKLIKIVQRRQKAQKA